MSEPQNMWNSAAGQAWVDSQDLLDAILQPYEDVLLEALAPGQVLDVGCGTGGTTIAIARRVGNGTGIDISKAMIDAARARAAKEGSPATFVLADAEAHTFAPESFDAILSRFGVMFFADSVRAFTNLRAAARTGAGLRFIAWRSADENPFMTAAERAARPLLPDLPARRPDEPGQFAFGDRDRVERILRESGWSAIDVRPIDVPCTMPEPSLVPYLTRMGPVGRALQEVDAELRARVVPVVRAAFEPWVHGAEVRFTGACWLVTATK